jgi:hypothetical protein
MTADEYHERAKEAKALAVETQDLWERELLAQDRRPMAADSCPPSGKEVADRLKGRPRQTGLRVGLHDIPRNLPFRVEMWDQSDQHIRWVIAASASVAVGHAAMDAAIANYPDQRFTLRNGILVIRQHPRKAA